jgi:formylglycine-generating enzyme required for sulfatase activity
MLRLTGILLVITAACALATDARSQTAQERRLREGTALLAVTRPDGTDDIGTGITVGSQDSTIYLATALHVVAGPENTWDSTRWERAPERINIEVEFPQDPGRRYRGKLFPRWDSKLDLAVVVVEDARLSKLGIGVAFGIGSPAALQAPYAATALGHPDRRSWLAADARVTDVSGDSIVLGGSSLGRGFSGGPLLDARRQLLIGMMKTISIEGNRAASMPLIANRLREWQIPHGLREAKVSSPMVRVPAGRFVMGSRFGPADAQPEREIFLDAFFIDKYEVTVAEFRRFVDDTGYTYVPGIVTCNFSRPGFEHHPINCITWHDAQAFASWAGKSLPTEAQWEKAARGPSGALWPWGDTPPKEGDAAVDIQLATHGGSFRRDISPYGIADALGNVSEWVADWYGDQYQGISTSRNPSGPAKGEDRVIRGGSFSSDRTRANLVRRHKDLPENGRQKLEYGFRCVLPAD